MKKMLGIIISAIFIFTGCSKNNDEVLNKLKDKLKNVNSYQITGLLEISNNETIYKYDIEANYEKKDKYKVSFKNKTNNHEQIILKNNDGVYVITPELNKSFKFQSDWPYTNSQSYLYQSILNDIENDDNVKISNTKDGYVIETKVNYENKSDLKYQKIYIDSKLNIKKIEVYDNEDIIKIKMTYKKVKQNISFDEDTFKIKLNNEKKEKKTKTLDVTYPLYIPENTKLESSKMVEDRTILTFAGDKSFTIIEQVANDDMETINMNGDIELITDVFGNLEDKSASWISNGIEYYIAANNIDKEELLKVINSINNVAIEK